VEIEGVKYHFSEHEAIEEIVSDIKSGKLQMVNTEL
jgi:hypothetical protein